MIRGYIPSVHSADLSGDTRVGACHMIEDDNYVLCIDGRFGNAAKRVTKRLNDREKRKILFLTHPHGDHYNGIEYDINNYSAAHVLICPDPSSYNKNYSSECKSNVAALERIIKSAKAKGIKVIYAGDGQRFSFGDIDFVVYRNQPSSARNTETYINQGSLCLWFPTLKYLYTGDTGAYCVEDHNLKPVFIGGFHHGNWLSKAHATKMKANGCLYYWDDDYSETITSFLSTGRGNAQEVGMNILSVHGDINFVAYSGKVVIYKGTKHWSYKCSYNGANELKTPDLGIVMATLRGTLGNGDERITNLLDQKYAPSAVQRYVNEIYKLTGV